MTDTADAVADRTEPIPSTSDDNDVAADDSTRASRVLLLLCAVAATVPFFWAAIRDARNGFYPTMDFAATVIQGRATFSSHPPLVGMWSSGSSWAGHQIHFPGPILLYWLAAPTHLLGNTWGPLLAMAVLNAFWVLLIGWLVYRLVGVHAALLTFLCLNAFIWSIGSENLIDGRPMEMVTIPFFCYLFATWLVAAGKIDALPAWALIGNFLFLDHLVQAVQIPVIGICAVVGVVLWIRRTRVAHASGDLDDAAYAAASKRFRKRLIQTGAATFVLWLPSLIQQVTTNPGNLTLLAQASGQHRQPVGSYVVGYNAVARLIAKPPFWFRGRFDNWSLRQGLQNASVGDVAAGIVLCTILIVVGIAARRRNDHLGLSAVVVSGVAMAASIVTVVQAPGAWGFPIQYLRSLWGLAAFVWFAVVFNAWRMLRPRMQVRAASAAGIAAVGLGILGLSFANYAAATDMDHGPFARQLVAEVVPQLTDRGTIHVMAAPNFYSERYFASLLLALDTADVPWCVDKHTAQQYGDQHDCASRADVHVLVSAPFRVDVDGAKVIARVDERSAAEKREYASTRRVFSAWLAAKDEIELTSTAWSKIDAAGPAYRRAVTRALSPADGDLSGLLTSAEFRLLIGFQNNHLANPDASPAIFADPTMPVAAITRYFELTDPTEHGTVWVLEVPRGWQPAR